MKIPRLLRITVVTGIALIFIIELILRVEFNQRLRERHLPEVYQVDTAYGYRYIPNAQDYKSSPAFYNANIKINSIGYPDQEFSIKKDSGYYRIIFVASSNGAGLDTDGPANYISILRDKITKAGHKVEIINCSVDGGYRDVQRVELVKKEIVGYDPDAIFIETELPVTSNFQYRSFYRDYQICNYRLNNLEGIKKYIDETHYNSSLFEILFKCFYSFRYICKYYIENDDGFTSFLSSIKPFKNKTRIQERVVRAVHIEKNHVAVFHNMEESFNFLYQLNDTLSKQGIDLVVYQSSIYDKLRKYFYSTLGIKYLSILMPFKDEYTFGKLNCHFSQKGHKLYGHKFYKSILGSNLIPKKYLNRNAENTNYTDTILSPSLQEDSYLSKDILYDKNSLQRHDSIKVLFLNHRLFKKVGNTTDSFTRIRNSFKVANLNISIIEKQINDNASIDDFIKTLDKNISENDVQIVLPPFPFNQIQKNPESSIRKIKQYNHYLESRGIYLIFVFACDDYDILEYSTSNKKLMKYLLEKELIKCCSIRHNLRFPGNDAVTEQDLIERRALTNENVIYHGIIETLVDEGILSRQPNYAYKKHATSSSSENAFGFSNKNLTDGIKRDINYWVQGWMSDTLNANKNHSEWICIDLEQNVNINRVVLYPISKKNMKLFGFPIDFEIQLSNNGISWSSIHSEQNYSIDTCVSQIFDFNPTKTRYVRILGTNLRQNEYINGNLYKMAFSEIEVYALKY